MAGDADGAYCVLAILHDSTGKARRCDACGGQPALTGFARPAFLPFGGAKVWHLMLLCEKCSLKAIELSGKLKGRSAGDGG